jgi:hypothetical protein
MERRFVVEAVFFFFFWPKFGISELRLEEKGSISQGWWFWAHCVLLGGHGEGGVEDAGVETFLSLLRRIRRC